MTEYASAVSRSSAMFGQMNILPWVGEQYEQSGRVMLLFESQYDPRKGTLDDECIRSWNIRLLEDYCRGKPEFFLTKVARTLMKVPKFAGTDERETLRRTIYYNFIQFMIPRKKAANPSQTDYSVKEFDRVLSAAKPKIVISFGTGRVRSYLEKYTQHRSIIREGLSFPAHFGDTLVVNLPHPASRYSYAEAVNQLSMQLDRC